jgi:3-keto-5-aminohexanoate cleavage enzyme
VSERGDRSRFDIEERNVFWPVHLEPKTVELEPLMIIVAPTGGSVTRHQNPHQPYLAEEILKEVKDSFAAGAQVHHFHVRDEKGFGSERIEDYKHLYDLVTAECPGMAISLNLTRPLDNDSVEERFTPEKLPYGDTVVVNVGSMNIGEKVFINSERFIIDACKFLEERGIVPELAVYNLRMMEDVSEILIAKKAITAPYFINICLGIHSATPATVENLLAMLKLLPEGARWMLTTGGRNWLPLSALAIAMGGHVRVGMEDTVHYYNHSDEIIDSCGTCVEKIASIAEAMGRPLATLEETRDMLTVSGKKRNRQI